MPQAAGCLKLVPMSEGVPGVRDIGSLSGEMRVRDRLWATRSQQADSEVVRGQAGRQGVFGWALFSCR